MMRLCCDVCGRPTSAFRKVAKSSEPIADGIDLPAKLRINFALSFEEMEDETFVICSDCGDAIKNALNGRRKLD